MSLPTIREFASAFSNYFMAPGPATATPFTRQDAEKTCGITDPKNAEQSWQEYFQCAQDLRGRAEYFKARTILRSLVAHSIDPASRKLAKDTLYDSQGDGGSWINLLLSAVGLVEAREWSDESDAASLWSSLTFGGIFAGSLSAMSAMRHTRRMTLGTKLLSSAGTAAFGTSWMNDRAYDSMDGAPVNREFDHRPAP